MVEWSGVEWNGMKSSVVKLSGLECGRVELS